MSPDASPASLPKTELEWLNRNIQLSYAYEIKSNIKRKIRILEELELPLLIEKGFISQPAAVTSNCNTVTTNCNNDTTWKKPDSSSFLQNKQAFAGIWTRDLCLTRRMILDLTTLCIHIWMLLHLSVLVNFKYLLDIDNLQ